VVVSPANPTVHTAVIQASADEAQWDEQLLLLRITQEHAGLWIQGLGRWSSVDAASGAPGFHTSANGVMAGADGEPMPGVLAGASAAYVVDHVWQGQGGSGSAETGRLSLYGRWSLGSAALTATFGGAYDRFTADRAAAPARVAHSMHDGYEIGGALQVSWRADLGGLEVNPRAGLSWQDLWQSAFSESGAGGFGIDVQPGSMQTLRPFVGADFGKSFDLGSGRTLRASGDVTWWYETLDRRGQARVFAQDGTEFDVAGPPVGRGAVMVGASLEAVLSSRAELFADWRLEPKVSNATVQSATVGFRIRF
jgi:outer membrane autotransporter protein